MYKSLTALGLAAAMSVGCSKPSLDKFVAFDVDGDGKLDIAYTLGGEDECRRIPVRYEQEKRRQEVVFDVANQRPCIGEDFYFLHGVINEVQERVNVKEPTANTVSPGENRNSIEKSPKGE